MMDIRYHTVSLILSVSVVSKVLKIKSFPSTRVLYKIHLIKALHTRLCKLISRILDISDKCYFYLKENRFYLFIGGWGTFRYVKMHFLIRNWWTCFPCFVVVFLVSLADFSRVSDYSLWSLEIIWNYMLFLLFLFKHSFCVEFKLLALLVLLGFLLLIFLHWVSGHPLWSLDLNYILLFLLFVYKHIAFCGRLNDLLYWRCCLALFSIIWCGPFHWYLMIMMIFVYDLY